MQILNFQTTNTKKLHIRNGYEVERTESVLIMATTGKILNQTSAPIFKSVDETLLANCRPISVLTGCFTKILERIMYNRLYNCVIKNNILYKKRFGSQANHSTDHAIIQLIDQIYSSFS